LAIVVQKTRAAKVPGPGAVWFWLGLWFWLHFKLPRDRFWLWIRLGAAVDELNFDNSEDITARAI
jgi:hypothetical protein